jgi:PST family polysaccharide transporter
MPDISIKKATLINAVSKYSTVVLNIVFTAILSRILTPNDYGIVAIVTVFTTFFSWLADLGMGTAVIQDKTLSNDEINHIFIFTVYIAVGLVIVFSLFGFFIAWFYQNKSYIPIACILSISVFFNTVNTIPNALLLKKKRFFMVGMRLIIITICTYIITIILALLNFKYYALIIQSILSALFVFLWNLKNVRFNFFLKINIEIIKKIRQYSVYQFGFNFINYFARNLDNLIIGKVWGDVPLAQYDKAYRFMLYPINNLTRVISSTLHPILSEHQNNKEFIYQKYLQIIKILSILGIFISIFCFWCSTEIIILVFGNQWYDAISCFKWLSLSVWAQMVASSAGAIYQSIGNTKLMFMSGLVHVGISVICIFIGIQTGNMEKFSILVSSGFVIKFFIEYFFLIKKGFGKRFSCFLYNFIPDIIISIILFFSSFVFSRFLNNLSLSLMISFICKLIFIIIIYFICLLITKQWKYIKQYIFQK